MKFRKKPVVIDAVRVPVDGPKNKRDFEAWGRLLAWLDRGPWMVTEDLGIDIKTLEGTMHASPGDWIIRGVQGEIYPCKPDIFAQTYEPAAPEPITEAGVRVEGEP